MADNVDLGRTSLAAARRRALLPRRILLTLAGVLCALGVKGLVAPAPALVERAATPVARAGEVSSRGFAEAFARAYLTWDPVDPERHSIDLAPFLGPDVDVDAGLPVPAEGAAQRVTWTTVLDEVETDPGRTAVTVAAAIDGEPRLRYLSVPVAATDDGALAVVDYPAAIGAPRLASELGGRDGDDVDDAELVSVVERALGNYLSGAAENLRADLAPDAVLALPSPALSVDDVVSLEWAGRDRGRVSAVVVASDEAGVAYTLRYELAVVQNDRWYVAEINPPMARKESSS